VPGARVSWQHYPSINITVDMPGACYFRMGPGDTCSVQGNDQGIVDLPPMHGRIAYRYTLSLGATSSDERTPYGGVYVELTVDPVLPTASLVSQSGSGQRAALGTTFSNPLVARVLGADGRPVAGVAVDFLVQFSPDATARFGDQYQARVLTDAAGNASAPLLTPFVGLGRGDVIARYLDPIAMTILETPFEFTSTTANGATDLALQDMWWSGFDENGWGISIAQRDDRLFPVVFAYNDDGTPTWYVMPGQWGGGSRYKGFHGGFYAPRGSPYFAYDASKFVVGSPFGNADLYVDSETSMTLRYVKGVQFQKPLSRQDFGSGTPAPITGLGGMWWGGESQAGWGIALMEQRGGLFSVWLTYDGSGDRTWFVMPSGTWTDSSTYEGTIYRTHGSPWLGVAYDASKLQVIAVGSFRYRFSDIDNATFDYTAQGYTGTLHLTRQLF
jgi:hypothetical protein